MDIKYQTKEAELLLTRFSHIHPNNEAIAPDTGDILCHPCERIDLNALSDHLLAQGGRMDFRWDRDAEYKSGFCNPSLQHVARYE